MFRGGIFPEDSWETGKVTVERHDRASVLNRQRSQMSIIEEIASAASYGAQQSGHHVEVKAGRFHHDRSFSQQPGFDDAQRRGERKSLREKLRFG